MEGGTKRNINLRTAGDFLKLVGRRVSFGTYTDGFWEGDVEDLSDSGTHVILRHAIHMRLDKPQETRDSKSLSLAEIDFAQILDFTVSTATPQPDQTSTIPDAGQEKQPRPAYYRSYPGRKEPVPGQTMPVASAKPAVESDNHDRKYLRFMIIHESAADIVEETTRISGNSSEVRTTWNQKRFLMTWKIVRPETNSQIVTRKCDYCDAVFKIKVKNLDFLTSQREKYGKMVKIGLIVILASIAGVIIDLLWQPVGGNFLGFTGLFGVFAGFLMIVGGLDLKDQPGFSTQGDLVIRNWGDENKRPFNGHYVDVIESSTVDIWND